MLPVLAVGWRASVLRGKEAEHFREVAGVSILIVWEFRRGGGLMNRIKVPLQDSALKMQGGGVYLRDTTVFHCMPA